MLRQTTAACALLSAALAAHGAQPPEVERLHRLFDAEWERNLQEDPVGASYLGDPRYNHLWGDDSLEAIAASHEKDKAALVTLEGIARAKLPPAEQLNYDLFKKAYEDGIEGYRHREFLMPVNALDGIQLIHEIGEFVPLASAKDYRDWATRLETLPTVLEQTEALMRQGMKEGRVMPKAAMQRVVPQIAAQVVDKPEDSPFYAAFKRMPEAIPAAEREAMAARARTAIADKIVPDYRRFQAFFVDEYLPASRDSIAATALPDGSAYYAYRVRVSTTTRLTPEQIHDIGLKEVARIRGEMEKVIARTGFKGSFDEFLKFLREDPRFYFKNGEDLLNAYLQIAKKLDGELPRQFRRLPRLPYGIRAAPDVSAPSSPTGSYLPGAADGSRAGFFYANLYKPETRPRWEMEALTAHEAVPGHHLQIALAQELGELPEFRRFGLHYTAYVEGWGLYSESLGEELGLYKDLYSKFGQLTYEMWRAVRLVVDTGMHAKGWTREQAIDYFLAQASKNRHDVEVEVDRYIVWPGQALAYKTGELKIKELRAKAAQALGEKFDVRGFHDVVLGSGAVPLDVLERNVERWIAGAATERTPESR